MKISSMLLTFSASD